MLTGEDKWWPFWPGRSKSGRKQRKEDFIYDRKGIGAREHRKEILSTVRSELDKAVKKGLIKKNTASRRKAKLYAMAKAEDVKLAKATKTSAKTATEKAPATKKAAAKKTTTAKKTTAAKKTQSKAKAQA